MPLGLMRIVFGFATIGGKNVEAGIKLDAMAYKNKTTQKNALDRIASAYIRTIGKCEYCGSRDVLQNSHIIGRKYLKVRFDPRNCQCLCVRCHTIFEGNPLSFAEWVLSSTCGVYVDTMQVQAYDISHKPDYDFWETTLTLAVSDQKPVELLRQELGQTIIL